MSTIELRKCAKAMVDEIPAKSLKSALSYIDYLIKHGNRPPLEQRLKEAEREFRAGRGARLTTLKRKYRRA